MSPRTYKQVEKWILKTLQPLSAAMGFHHQAQSYFVRARERLVEVFFFDVLRPDMRSFCIYYGVDAPFLLRRVREQVGVSTARPSPCVGAYLKRQKWYSSWDAETTERSVASAFTDFKAEALP